MSHKMHCIIPLIALVMSLGFAANSGAIEKLNARELQTACELDEKKSATNVSPCAMYVQGFFAGMKIYGNKPASQMSFQERALKTRAGNQLDSDVGIDKGDYCLPEETSLAAFIAKIRESDGARFASQTADQLIRAILHQHYRCR